MAHATAVLVSCSGKRADTSDRPGLVAEVKQGELTITVKASGEIRASKSNKIIPKLKKSGTIGHIVREGQRVTAGEVVARFNTDDIERQIWELEARLMDQKAKLDNAETDLEIQRIDNATNLKLAAQAVRSAEMELRKFMEGDDPLKRRSAELEVQTSESEKARLERRYAEIKELLKEGFVTEDQVEEERIALESAKVALETAHVELQILNDYTLPLEKAKVESELAKARTELEKVRKRNDTLLASKIQAVAGSKLAVERTERELSERQTELKECVVKAPTDGIVTYADPNRPWRRTEVDVGANIHPGQVLMTIPDMSTMRAVINIPEADIDKIALDQAATISVEALADRTFSGKVVKIAEVANPQGWWGSDVKSFEVEVSVNNGKDLKPGFSCHAEIVADKIESALHVPVQAVFREEDSFFVYRAGGRPGGGKAKVTIGKSSETHVQILEGVELGQIVRLTVPEKEGTAQ